MESTLYFRRAQVPVRGTNTSRITRRQRQATPTRAGKRTNLPGRGPCVLRPHAAMRMAFSNFLKHSFWRTLGIRRGRHCFWALLFIRYATEREGKERTIFKACNMHSPVRWSLTRFVAPVRCDPEKYRKHKESNFYYVFVLRIYCGMVVSYHVAHVYSSNTCYRTLKSVLEP